MDAHPSGYYTWKAEPASHRKVAHDLRDLGERYGKAPEIVHSYQGCQYSSYDWQAFLKAHGLVPSMSRHSNRYDNAIAESCFQPLKREPIRRKTYLGREEARRDVFNYIEMFYNPRRRHGYANNVSSVEFEYQYFNRLQSV